MTDQNIPADKVQEVIDFLTGHAKTEEPGDYEIGYANAIQNCLSLLDGIVPEPPRPTLADMTKEERRECKWMQADTEELGRFVIVNPCESGIQAGLISRMGNVTYESSTRITPRPDLPRMEWPGEQKPSPALPGGWRLADHPEHGRVIVTKPTLDSEGCVYYVCPSDALSSGYDWHYCDPADLKFLDTNQ